MRNSRSVTMPPPRTSVNLARMSKRSRNSRFCQIASSVSTTRDPRTSAFGQACTAMRLPTAAGQAANASWSGEIASESLSLARDLPARSIRTELNSSIHDVSVGFIQTLHSPDGEEQAAHQHNGGEEEHPALFPS